MNDKLLTTPPHPERFAAPDRQLQDILDRRLNANPETVERGLVQLVLTVIELIRQLMERQALRRIDGGDLSDETIERMGRTFMELDRCMSELRERFGLTETDLNLDLGPIGRLL